jgi:hypothetical protein
MRMDVSEFLFKPRYVCVCVRHGCRLTLCPRFDLIAGSSEADSISKEQFLNKLFRPQVAVAPLAFLCGLNIQH